MENYEGIWVLLLRCERRDIRVKSKEHLNYVYLEKICEN